jgi:hypothetical protein
MKKRYMFVGMLAMGALLFASCSKEHQCKCFKVDNPNDVIETEMIFILDGGTSCEDIHEMSIEQHVATREGQTLERVEVHPVKCREYNEN